MKTKLGLALAVAALALMPSQSRAVTGNVNAQGRIAPPLQITATRTLDFGNVIVGAGGSVHLTSGGVETDVGVTQIGATTVGTLNLSGRCGSTVNTFSFASNNFTCAVDTDPVGDCVGGTNTVTVSVAGADASFAAGGALPAGAGRCTTSVSFGGTMSVAANQNSGLYAGTLVVTAAY